MTEGPTLRPQGPTSWWFFVLMSGTPAWMLAAGLAENSDWRVMFGLAYFSFLPALIALDRQQAQRRLDR
ncbi:hypothetical protein [Aeromicrobium sp. Sec7.5]|uniref:hypothetical protein n=1 Tax=Aeromicrobium sp. Sec7.5 TaxID=3121276 RepID=UPI002FE445F1